MTRSALLLSCILAGLGLPSTPLAKAVAPSAPPLGHPDFRPTREHPIGWRGDWTGRYPGADPVTAWDITRGINVRWRVLTHTMSNATPLVVGDKLFVNADPCLLVCLDKMNGRVLWVRDISAGATTQSATRPVEVPAERVVATQPASQPWSRRKLSYGQWATHSMPTPICDGQRIWIKNGGVAACFDLNGNRLWATRTNLAGTDHPMNVPSPVLAGNVLACEGGITPYWEQNGRNKIAAGVIPPNPNMKFKHWMVGLDATTGKIIWDLGPLNAGGYGGAVSPCTVTLGSGAQRRPYILTGEGHLIRAEDGKLISPYVGMRGPFASPVPLGEQALCMPHRKIALVDFAMKGPDEVLGQVRWTNAGGCGMGGAVYHEGLVYSVAWAKENVCVNVCDLATGQSVFTGPVMKPAPDSTDWPHSALGGKYIFLFTSHRVAVLEPGRTPRVVAISEIERMFGGPAFEGDRMYLRTNDSILCIGRTGEEGARYEREVQQRTAATKP